MKKYHVTERYYDEIDAEMAKLKEPTLENAIAEMRRKGNFAFVAKWKHLKGAYAPFEPAKINHEAAHLCLRTGHTPEEEIMLIPFLIAFRNPDDGPPGDPTWLNAQFIDMYAQYREARIPFYKDPSRPLPALSKKDTAIFYAAGLYLRHKLELFHSLGLAARSYPEQKTFADEYAKKESEGKIKHARNVAFDNALPLLSEGLPYDLIKISPAEMQAITEVATGQRAPSETPYPERLAAIRRVLDKTGLAVHSRHVRASGAYGSGAGLSL